MTMRLFFYTIAITTGALLFAGCLSVSPLYKKKLKNEDFTTLSNRLIDLRNKQLVGGAFLTDTISDADLKSKLNKLNINYISINGNDSGLVATKSDSLIFFNSFNNNLSIRIYNLEKSTTIIYDYSAAGTRDLSSNKDFWVSATKKIKNRLYAYKSKEPGVR